MFLNVLLAMTVTLNRRKPQVYRWTLKKIRSYFTKETNYSFSMSSKLSDQLWFLSPYAGFVVLVISGKRLWQIVCELFKKTKNRWDFAQKSQIPQISSLVDNHCNIWCIISFCGTFLISIVNPLRMASWGVGWRKWWQSPNRDQEVVLHSLDYGRVYK